jgi:hypothetical protein
LIFIIFLAGEGNRLKSIWQLHPSIPNISTTKRLFYTW